VSNLSPSLARDTGSGFTVPLLQGGLNSTERRMEGAMQEIGGVSSEEIPHQGKPCSLALTLPPLSTIFLKQDVPDSSRALSG